MILSHHRCYMTLSYADGEAEGMDVECWLRANAILVFNWRPPETTL